MRTVRVRPAAPEDARGIAETQARAWDAAYRGLLADAVIDALTADVREARWREILAADESATWVADEAGRIAGFCSVLAVARDADALPGTSEIAALYVDPAVWRRGAGSALLRAGVAALGPARVTLWVLERNAAARAFYAGHGFSPDGARRETAGAAHVRLARPADPVS